MFDVMTVRGVLLLPPGSYVLTNPSHIPAAYEQGLFIPRLIFFFNVWYECKSLHYG